MLILYQSTIRPLHTSFAFLFLKQSQQRQQSTLLCADEYYRSFYDDDSSSNSSDRMDDSEREEDDETSTVSTLEESNGLQCIACTGHTPCSEMVNICSASSCPAQLVCRTCYCRLPGYPTQHHCPHCRRECSPPVLDFSKKPKKGKT